MKLIAKRAIAGDLTIILVDEQGEKGWPAQPHAIIPLPKHAEKHLDEVDDLVERINTLFAPYNEAIGLIAELKREWDDSKSNAEFGAYAEPVMQKHQTLLDSLK